MLGRNSSKALINGIHQHTHTDTPPHMHAHIHHLLETVSCVKLGHRTHSSFRSLKSHFFKLSYLSTITQVCFGSLGGNGRCGQIWRNSTQIH